MQAYANLGEATATWRELLLLLAEEACARPHLHKSLPAVAWSLTVAGCLPDPLLREVPAPPQFSSVTLRSVTMMSHLIICRLQLLRLGCVTVQVMHCNDM